MRSRKSFAVPERAGQVTPDLSRRAIDHRLLANVLCCSRCVWTLHQNCSSNQYLSSCPLCILRVNSGPNKKILQLQRTNSQSRPQELI